MFRNKTAMKIISLLAAVCLWMYVVGEVDPETKGKVGDIPVHFINTEVLAENGLAVVNEEATTINVVLKGKRSDVNGIKKAGLEAYVDVTDCEAGSNTRNIQINIPDQVTMDNISAESLTFTVEKLASQEKPVEIDFYGNTGSNELTPYIIECNHEEIAVSGAESSVNKIKALRGQISLENVPEEESKWITVDLEPVNKNDNLIGGIELENTSVKARVQMLQIKTVKLQIIKENLDTSVNVESMDVPENIVLAGPADIMEKIEKIEGIVDMSGVRESDTLPVQLKLPESVYLYDKDNLPTAEIIIEAEE